MSASVAGSSSGDTFYDQAASNLNDKLCCCSCGRYFNLDNRRPRVIPCRHVACELCLDISLPGPSEFACNLCGLKMDVKEARKVETFPEDELVLALIRFLMPDGMKCDFGDCDVPFLLNNIRLEASSGMHFRMSTKNDREVALALDLPGPSGSAASGSRQNRRGLKGGKDSRVRAVPSLVAAFESGLQNTLGQSSEQGKQEVVKNVIAGQDSNVSNPGQTSASSASEMSIINPVLEKFATAVSKLAKEEEGEMCTVCMDKLVDESPYDEGGGFMNPFGIIRLHCGHFLHHNCACQMISHQVQKDFFKCSTCNQVHGTLVGNQPEGGQMHVTLEFPFAAQNVRKTRSSAKFKFAANAMASSLPGFEGTGTYIVQYSFPPGIQGPNHPSPGNPYHLSGFPRVAYLPATEKGFEVLCMLKVAFDRRLVFAVGTSSTSGYPDCVIWAGIHHKTARTDGQYGYPDPTYLDRVSEELKTFGVTPTDIPADPKTAFGWQF